MSGNSSLPLKAVQMVCSLSMGTEAEFRRLNVICSEQGYVQEHLRENSNILLRNIEFSGMSSQDECFPSVCCSCTPWDLLVEEAVE